MTDATDREEELEAIAAALRRAIPVESKRHPNWPRQTGAVVLAALRERGYEVRRRSGPDAREGSAASRREP
jgi:hypothetical protein